MMMTTEFFEAFNRAIARHENREDGKINWNYVDADLWMDGVITKANHKDAYVWFNELADATENV